MRIRRTTPAIVIALVLLTACGGDDDTTAEPAAATDDASAPAGGDSTVDEPDPDDTAEQPADEPDAAAEEPPSPVAGGGDNIATVTIGGDTHEIDVTPSAVSRCDPDFFGAFWALGGDDTARIDLLLPPPGDPNFADEVPAIAIGVDDGDVEWIADPAREMGGVDAGESQVDSFSVDGNTVTGTATFVDLNATYAFQGGVGDKPVPVTGTFSITCAG